MSSVTADKEGRPCVDVLAGGLQDTFLIDTGPACSLTYHTDLPSNGRSVQLVRVVGSVMKAKISTPVML